MSSSGAPLKCRTCFEPKANDFYSLQDPFEHRTMGDLLLVVTKINTNAKDAERHLPQHICGNCTDKLKNAYAFVQQAQHVNEYLLKIVLPEAVSNSTSTSAGSIDAIKAAQLFELVDPLNEMNAEIKVEEEEEEECDTMGDECLYDGADVVTHAGGSGARLKRLKMSGERGNPKQKAQESRKLHESLDFDKDKDHTQLDPINMATAHWPPDDDNDDSYPMDHNNDSDSQYSIEPAEPNPNIVFGSAADAKNNLNSPLKRKCPELETKNLDLRNHLLRIESTLEKQTQTLAKHTFLLERIMEKAFPPDSDLNIFPLKSMEDLEATETLIASLPEQDLFKYVKDVVGYTPISNMATRFFTEDFVLQVNWDGNHGRVPLKTFKIFTWFIFGAVKKEDFGYPQFEEAMRKCLRVAKNRFYKKTHALKHKKIENKHIIY